MGIDAATRRDDGSQVEIPSSINDWQLWVSAGRTRNWMLKDPLLDWLQLYGKSHAYITRHEAEDYDSSLDFTAFILGKGQEFEEAILQLLANRYEVTTIAQDYHEIRKLEKVNETFDAMSQGSPIIYQGVLWDAHNLNYGSPDFMVRSDILRNLFPDSITGLAESAPDLGDRGWHYVIVDTKFTTLHLNASGTELANQGSSPAYKAQLYVYNRMLGRLQGFQPLCSYLLGRGWERTQRGDKHRGSSAMDRLGPVPQSGTVANRVRIGDEVERALAWLRRLRAEGEDWRLLPEPSVPELYPNMSNLDDAEVLLELGPPELEPGSEDDLEILRQWVGAKKWLAGELGELTQLWQVGVTGRELAHESGWFRTDSPGLTASALGVKGPKRAPVLNELLAVNFDGGPLVRPSRIESTEGEWYAARTVEFYVDFEFCSDLNDDFSTLPEKGGQPLIFMIGCGHVEDGEWRFKSLIANRLSEDEELRIIQEWIDHISAVRDRLDSTERTPRIFHWSHAEPTALENSYTSARIRHQGSADWPELGWYDLLAKVIREEPVVVRGALGFGLKQVANALYDHGLIQTNWADSPVDGLGAMVGAWFCEDQSQKSGTPMSSLPLMNEIAKYNEVDCKVMMEIVRYLRENH